MNYQLLGKSGLRVSELCLGTMTFGEEWGWGSNKDESGWSSTLTSKPAGISSIPPTVTPMAPVKRWSANLIPRPAR